MKTRIQTAHEETYSDNTRTLGILTNYSNEDNFKESFAYIYKSGMYIFFDTIIEMMDYLLYGESKMKRAYMEEVEFDKLFDSPYINGTFTEQLEWTK